MARINLLDAQTSNLIAAGEVVERPANVIKELLENAIDAGSTVIQAEIEGGGVDLIRVTDNGCGMEKEDLPLSIRRHATSKIRTSEDLTAIATLGFRGEALAAISSTSRFTVLSKRKEADLGHQMTVEGEEILSLEECGCADGTTVMVRDLFFNQPARKKFLKRPQTETSAIFQYIQRLAVSHPEIAFRFTADGTVKLQTAGNGKLSDCIWSVYGAEFYSALTELHYTEGAFTLDGFITRPEHARNNHSFQSFYINSRYVKSRTMQFALEDAYKSFVKTDKFPGCVLFLTLDPERVDVNVHPAKLEVRFDDERSVYNAVYQGVRQTLSNLSNRLARDSWHEAVKEVQEGKGLEVPVIHEVKETPRPSQEVISGSFQEKKLDLPLFSAAPNKGKSHLIPEENQIFPQKAVVEKANLFEEATPPASHTPVPPISPFPKTEEPVEQLVMEEAVGEEKENNPLTGFGTVRGVLFHAYILYEAKDMLYLIDKHAAHERILYEGLKKNHKSDSVQLFLEPLLLSLSPDSFDALSAHQEEMQSAGFLLEEFGEGAFLLRGVPMEFVSLSSEQMIKLMEDSAKELSLGGKAAGAGEKLFDRTLYSMACKAAVKAGIPTSGADHDWLVEKLKKIDNITVCPHGRPVLISFTKKQIENMFLRT